MISNVALTCNASNGNCATFQNQLPPNGNHNQDGGVVMEYVDIDSDPSTWMSSSDSLALPSCSEVSFAGLYWSARVQPNTSEYVNRNQVRVKLGNFFYQTFTADETLDVLNIPTNPSFGMPGYYCYKNITPLVQASGGNARFTIANISSETGDENLFGAWTIVVVYSNQLESMRNLTVFDGMGYVSGQNNLDIPISGFLTPTLGPVSFELGVVAYEGDRSIQGDRFQFQGSGGFLDVPDPLRNPSDFFNSTITSGGALTPFRNPSFNNMLGFDNGIFIPDNSAFTYIGNAATNATIRVATSQDAILPRIITSAIDIYEPDLRATVFINDINGAPAEPGDILEYTVTGKNIGSDVSLGTYMETTLNIRTEYIPNSIEYLNGGFIGAKTDASGDDQAEYDAASRIVRTRINLGADAITGGTMTNSATGADSSSVKFRVQVVDDCIILDCDSTLENEAYIYGNGQISGNLFDNNGVSASYDANGCPSATTNVVTVFSPNCDEIEISHNEPLCEGDTITFVAPVSDFVTYEWQGPNGFSSSEANPVIPDITVDDAGVYSLLITLSDSTCAYDLLLDTVEIEPAPTLILDSLVNVTCNGFDNGIIAITPQGLDPIDVFWSNFSTDTILTQLPPDTFVVQLTDQNGCDRFYEFEITEPTALTSNTGILSNYNGSDVSCFGVSDGSVYVNYFGATAPYNVSWSPGFQTTDTIVDLPAGEYIATITDSNSCEILDTIVITEPLAIQASDSVVNVSCNNGSDGEIFVSVSDGTPGYVYNWIEGTTGTDSSIDSLSSGLYVVEISDTNACVFIDSIQVNQPLTPISLSETHVDVLCFGDSTGNIDLSAVGGTQPYNYLWINDSISQDLTDLFAGIYNVTVTDSLGCFDTLSIEITEPLAPLSVVLNTIDVLCYGDFTGSVDATIAGGTAPYTYLWSNGEITEDISNIPAGNYSIQVTDFHNCSFSVSSPITEPSDSLLIELTSFDADCFGAPTGSILGSVSGGTAPYDYLWSNGEITDDLANLTAGIYTLTVTDDNNCVASFSDTVKQPDGVILSHIQTDILCFGDSTGSIDLNVQGGVSPYAYLWSTGDTTQDISGIPAGTYDVDVFDNNNCLAERQIEIIEPLSSVSLSETHTDALCTGGSQGSIDLSVSGGTPGYSIVWNNNEITEDIIDLVAGTYTAQATDDNGCVDSLSIEILDPSNTMVLSVSETNVLCFADSTGEIDLTVTGGASPYSFDWSNGDDTEDIDSLITGNYFVIVQDNNFCESFISGFIDQPLAPISTTDSIIQVLCNGDSTGAIFLETSGGTPSYTYLWSNGTTEDNIDSLWIGDYNITITDDHLCTQQFTYAITEPTDITLTDSITDVSCFGGSDGAIDINPGGGVPPYSYLWSTGDTIQDIDSLVFGNYTIQITDTNGCIEEQTYLVGQPATPVAIADTSGNISCFGGNDGFIDITVTGGNGGYSFDWSNAALTEDLTDLFVGVYIIEVEDSLGCFSSDTITLTEPLAPLSLTTEMTAVLCFGEANGIASVEASGGTAPYSYLWSNTETTDTITGLLIGDYTVLVTDSLGCIDSAVVTVTEPPVLTAVADSIDVLCFGDSTGSVTVSPQGGMLVYDYLWDTGDITATVTDLPAGFYEVTVTDTNGCTFITNTTINQPLAPLSDTLIIADNLCFGEDLGSIDATISGGTVPYDYSWSNGETTEDIDSLANGLYTLTVTDDNLCVLVIDTVITSPTEIDITHVQTNVSCFGGNDATIDLTVGGAVPPYSYLWNTGDTLQDLDSLFVGTYDVIITDSNNCEDPYTVTITEPLAPLALSADSINVACFGDSTGSIDLTVTGGTIAYSFSWSNGEVTEDIIDIPTGTYQVIVTDDNLCVDSLSMSIDQPAAPIALSATQVDILCFGDFTGEIDLTVTGGTPATTGYVYDWNNGLSADEDLTGLPFGTYDVLVTDSLLCSDSLTVTLTEPAIAIDIEFTILNVACFGDSTGDVSAVISGGTGPYTWFWDFPIADTTLFIDSLPADGYVLNVLDSNNCTYAETAVVTEPAGPLTSAYADVQPSCFEYEDGSLTLIPSGGTPDYSYLWNTGDTTLSIDSLTTGDYSVEIYDALGCYFALDIFLDEPPELQISFDVDSLAGCSPFTVSFTNTSNATADCEWDFGDGNTFSGCEDVVNIYEEGGIYSVSLTAYDDNGCFNDVTYNDFITVYQTPTAGMNIDPQILFPETPTTDITNTSIGASMYVWNMGDSPQDYGFFEPGAYTYSPNVQDTFVVTLLVISDDGCTDSTSDIVIFRNDPFFFAPNSFTPDGNNLNEVWIPVFSSPDYVERYDLQVYNRWGELVFGTDQVTQGWNGMVDNSGNIAQDGIYTWKMSFKWYDQRTYQLTGHITLIR